MWAGIITGTVDMVENPVTVYSRFLIQSITKTFAAVVILRLVASGKLRLDAPMSECLPDVPNASSITIRQCLQHTSGLPDYGPLPEYHEAVRSGRRPWTYAEFLERTHAETLLFEPGRGWRYSNIGYMILRRLIETVNGQSFADTIAAEICRPLGLSRTSVVRDRADLRELTAGYSTYLTSAGSPVDVRDIYDPAWISTGVVAATAPDIVRFYHGLFAGELLPPVLLNEMCSIVRAAPSHPGFVTPSYGLGLMADPDSVCSAMYGHNGGGPGYTASAFHFTVAKPEAVTVAVLSNTENPEAVQIMALAVGKALVKEARE
jgi:D-alanyl-D-alanine carboxypeptidase